MIDDHRVRQMAREYEMNPSAARQLLKGARDVPALRRGRWYRLNLAAAQVRMGIEQGIKAAIKEAMKMPKNIHSVYKMLQAAAGVLGLEITGIRDRKTGKEWRKA